MEGNRDAHEFHPFAFRVWSGQTTLDERNDSLDNGVEVFSIGIARSTYGDYRVFAHVITNLLHRDEWYDILGLTGEGRLITGWDLHMEEPAEWETIWSFLDSTDVVQEVE